MSSKMTITLAAAFVGATGVLISAGHGFFDSGETATRPPQAHEERQHVQAGQPEDQAPYPRGAHLSQRREPPGASPGIDHRDTPQQAGGDPLSQHGILAQPREGSAVPGRVNNPSPALRPA